VAVYYATNRPVTVWRERGEASFYLDYAILLTKTPRKGISAQ